MKYCVNIVIFRAEGEGYRSCNGVEQKKQTTLLFWKGSGTHFPFFATPAEALKERKKDIQAVFTRAITS